MAQQTEVRVPDIGDFEEVEVIEVLVSEGDRIGVEDSLITLESDKATMEIPSPVAGVIASMQVSVGDRVSEGTVMVTVAAEAEAPAEPAAKAPAEPAAKAPAEPAAEAPAEPTAEAPAEPAAEEQPPAAAQPVAAGEVSAPKATPGPAPGASRRPPAEPEKASDAALPHASPLVRGVARELGVDLKATAPSGPAGRVLVDDVKAHVRERMAGGGGTIPPIPEIDFGQFGPVEDVPLSKIRRVAATNLHRSWLNVPHVTQHDEADVTSLESFRKARSAQAKERGLRLSPLLFLMKAVVISLRRFPDFRSSLSPDGQSLIRKNYFNLGIAVDTEEGLMVPVVREVDGKSIFELAAEVAELAERARSRKLGMKDLQGAVFTISSLGGIGGTAFTPIVNAPEVGILGVSRTVMRPVWKKSEDGGGSFEPRQILPLSLSYDHRVIDGAMAVRFTTDLVTTLSDPVNLLV